MSHFVSYHASAANGLSMTPRFPFTLSELQNSAELLLESLLLPAPFEELTGSGGVAIID